MTAPSSFYSGAYAPISSFQATSSDSVLIGTGGKTFNTQAGKTFQAGDYVLVFSNANNANFMSGVITSYTGTVIVVNVTAIGGAGTFSDWHVDLSGSPGSTGPTGPTGPTGSSGAGVAAQTAHAVVVAATATTLSTGVVLTDGQLVVGATGADPTAQTVSGDLTLTAAGVLTIGNTKVTYAKIQNVSATSRFLGRITAGAGSPEELTSANAVTILGGNIATLQASSTLDSVFYNSHTGVATAVALGASGTTLVSTGATVAPTAQAVLQPAVSSNLTAGFTATSFSAGTKSSGTFTPDPTQGNFQHYTNSGAHTLAPPSSVCSMVLECTNSGAGALTTSGFSFVDGDTYSNTGTKKHLFYITKTNSFSRLTVAYVTGT
jgi:hypothetical protein